MFTCRRLRNIDMTVDETALLFLPQMFSSPLFITRRSFTIKAGLSFAEVSLRSSAGHLAKYSTCCTVCVFEGGVAEAILFPGEIWQFSLGDVK